MAGLLLPRMAGAWGPAGHQVVAELASRDLSAAAREQVRDLLDGAGMPSVATWADSIVSQRPKTRRWHFVNIPKVARAYDAVRDCPQGECIIAALDRQIAILRDPARPKDARSEALRFVIHLVADLHQPLHCADNRDRGGNDVAIRWFKRRSNLHAVWDSDIVAQRGLSAAQLAARLRPELDSPALEGARVGTVVDWANESHRIAVVEAYRVPSGGKLDAVYYQRAQPLADRQLVRAAIRLAATLNEALGTEKGLGLPGSGGASPAAEGSTASDALRPMEAKCSSARGSMPRLPHVLCGERTLRSRSLVKRLAP
jgi:nuclease S1